MIKEPPVHETPQKPPVEEVPKEVSLGHVPNTHPIRSAPYRIAIIGESPNRDDLATGRPFSGQQGKFLDQVLSNAGILRDACFVGNVCQQVPPIGKDRRPNLSLFSPRGEHRLSSSASLATDLATFNPNVCLLLGKFALHAALNVWGLDDWKCSFFIGEEGAFMGRKCIATYHPDYALRQYGDYTPWITFAAAKAKREGHRKELIVPTRILKVNPTFDELIADLDKILTTKCRISADIEGGIETMSCCSFATSPDYSFIVPFAKMNGDNWWKDEYQEAEVWQRFVAILSDPAIPKIFQNALYDRFVLHQGYNVVVKGNTEDTMLKWWELYAELEKNLGVQTSILTEQPYYKWMGRAGNRGEGGSEEQYFRYCCLDSAVTFEIADQLEKYLNPQQLAHYHRNVELLHPLLYMELRGIKYNHALAKERLTQMKGHVYGYQNKLDKIATEHEAIVGIDYAAGNSVVLASVREKCCNKIKARKGVWSPTKKYQTDYPLIAERLDGDSVLSEFEQGWISVVCGATMNTKSPKFKTFLYKTLKLPTQYKKDPKTKEMRPTTDYLSLLKLSKKNPHPALLVALELSRLRTRAQMLAMRPYRGRMHCSYNLVGSETGRITSSKSILIAEGEEI